MLRVIWRNRKKQGPPLRTALLPNHRSGWGDMNSNIPPKTLMVDHYPAFRTLQPGSTHSLLRGASNRGYYVGRCDRLTC
jgi:hypothetical protein